MIYALFEKLGHFIMKANEIIQQLLKNCNGHPIAESATCFAPVNIALIKYRRNGASSILTLSTLQKTT